MGLTNTQYNTIMRDYERQQASNQQELSRRRQEIYARIPEFAEIDAEIAAAGTACARAMLLGEDGATGAQHATAGDSLYGQHTTADVSRTDTQHTTASDVMHGMHGQHTAARGRRISSDRQALSDLQKKIDLLSSRRGGLLRAFGYPEDYLSPVYRCPDCQDTGYIGTEKCHCFRQAIIDLLYMQSNLREALQDENFSTFSLKYYSDQIIDPVTGMTAKQTAKRAATECRRFVKDFDSKFENIFLYGDTGLGKTFLSHCVARSLLDTTHSVIYFSAFRLFELFADTAFGRADLSAQNEFTQHIFECDFLIIDDLGTELVNSFVSSQLFLVLNERILRRKSTLISTNLALSTFADMYSERVFSRISSNYIMLRLIGDDIRLQKKLSHQKT